MSEPEHISRVVSRVLRGLDPAGDDEKCRGCDKLCAADDPGAQDGFCADCAREKRRNGEWHTPTLVDHRHKSRCPRCSHLTYGQPDADGLISCACGTGKSITNCNCSARFSPSANA